jgi:DNA-directed RNA polymerase subunit N (RpoN/RPB10)
MRVHFWASGCFLLYCKEEEYILKKGEILKEKKKSSRRKKKRWEVKKRSSRRKFKEGRRTMKKGKKKKLSRVYCEACEEVMKKRWEETEKAQIWEEKMGVVDWVGVSLNCVKLLIVKHGNIWKDA